MNKRYWLRGGIVGTIVAIVISIYSAMQDTCIGSYLNTDGTMGTVCPKVNIMMNIQNSIGYEFAIVIVLFTISAIVGWIYGKIKNRNINTNT